MTTVKKQRQVKQKQSKDTSKNEELVFTDKEKEPCDNCKEPKSVSLSLPAYTKEEMDRAMTLVDKFNIGSVDMKWLINLHNRVLNDNKRYGCGKCHVIVLKNLKNAYSRLYS
jgi:hypothetical protein